MAEIGRNQALAEAVDRYGERLLSAIRARVRDQAETEDVYQDVIEEFLEAYDVGAAIESAGAWLWRVAQNKIVDRFRRRKTAEVNRSAIEDVEREAPVSRPDEEWTRGWIRGEILDALEMLPAGQADVFIRHELEGQSYEEIANATGVGVNTLLSRKRAAVLFLRDYLKEVYDELE